MTSDARKSSETPPNQDVAQQLSLIARPNISRSNLRRSHDYYPTAVGVTYALLNVVPIAGAVAEPCCGDGAMARPLTGSRLIDSVTTNDIHPVWQADYHGDATSASAAIWTTGAFDWVVTNPPYRQAIQIVQRAYSEARIGIAVLLRLTFLEPTQRDGRGEWLKAHQHELAYLIPLNPRPSFTNDGRKDSVTVAWFVWMKGYSGGTQVRFTMNWNNSSRSSTGINE